MTSKPNKTNKIVIILIAGWVLYVIFNFLTPSTLTGEFTLKEGESITLGSRNKSTVTLTLDSLTYPDCYKQSGENIVNKCSYDTTPLSPQSKGSSVCFGEIRTEDLNIIDYHLTLENRGLVFRTQDPCQWKNSHYSVELRASEHKKEVTVSVYGNGVEGGRALITK